MDKYIDRHHAGILLAKYLHQYKENPNAIALALPRGGVPVGYEIAKELCIPLDVFIVRKLGVPGHEELAMGAITPDGTVIFNQEIVDDLHISNEAIQQVIQREHQELHRRELLYRQEKKPLNLKNKIIILVDDGIATGATTRAAIKALKGQDPARLILAVPVASLSTYNALAHEVDEFICPMKPSYFHAVGLWYEDFTQTMDSEVAELLQELKGEFH
jgi:putative phosphoribosyl transferase